ncbi:hypothetical protein BHE74_00020110 [Ensete ventricosum]|nr:hypothetical protein BHE74_00020110 [Ensete ventricosum]
MLATHVPTPETRCGFIVYVDGLIGDKLFRSSRPRPEQSLVQWATPQLHDIDALDRMVDPVLKGLYPAKSLSRFADVIALWVQRSHLLLHYMLVVPMLLQAHWTEAKT